MEEVKNNSMVEEMKQTLEASDLSVLGDIGEVYLDEKLFDEASDETLKAIPVIKVLWTMYKIGANVKNRLFARKLFAFLYGLKDTNPKNRAEAIRKWEEDAKYRISVGETLLNMVDRCDDTLKAQWLSKLFYVLVLKQGYCDLFMRAEKVLSGLSVMDMMMFLDQPEKSFQTIKMEDAEPFFHSGLYVSRSVNLVVNDDGFGKIEDGVMDITEVGLLIYWVLNDIKH